jgi:hypothetical protein
MVKKDFDKWDEDANNAGRDRHPHMVSRSIRQYRKILADASVPQRQKHFYHIKNWGYSKKMPIGGISLKIYRRLVQARQFDEFCRLMPRQAETKEEKVRGMRVVDVPDVMVAYAGAGVSLLPGNTAIGVHRGQGCY